MRHPIACGVGLAFLLAGTSGAKVESAAVAIRLDQIWGYNLPGTRDIAGIPLPEGDEKPGAGQDYTTLRRERERRIDEISRALAVKPPSERALPGFVFPRRADFYTLRGVASQLARAIKTEQEHQTSKKSFPKGEEFTLVFFSHPTSYYVRLKSVERQHNTFIVHYQFEPHLTAEATAHFALIPIGMLPAGEYHVDFQQTPIDQKYLDSGFNVIDDSSRVVCQPFSFTVLELPTYADEAPSEGATLIPLDRIWAHRMPGTKPVQELEELGPTQSEEERFERSQILQIYNSLSKPPKEGEKAGPAFVVMGKGEEALKNAYAVLTKKAEPAKVLPADRDLTLVFYSYLSAWYIHVASVEKTDRVITVKYRPVSHMTYDLTEHFALIPLGKLPEGTFRAEIKSLRPVDKSGKPGRTLLDPSRIISQDFSFEVN